MIKRIQKLAVVVFILISPNIYAWWDGGHMLVADIAYHYLTPQAKKTVNDLMKNMYLENTAKHRYFFNKKNPNYSLMAASNWPDHIKSFPNELALYHTHHYIEHAYTDDKTPLPNLIPRDNIVWAINQHTKHVANIHATPYSRARALAFLVHFVGDIHQPLHSTEYYSKQFPNGDRGGWLFNIKFKHKNGVFITNLHALWDSALALYPQKGSPNNVNNPKDIHDIMLSITKDYSKSYFTEKLKVTDPNNWHLESHRMGIDAHSLSFDATPSAAYILSNTRIAKQQLALAGYRLAALLNALLI